MSASMVARGCFTVLFPPGTPRIVGDGGILAYGIPSRPIDAAIGGDQSREG
jgi:hypothetical protein